MQREVPLGRMGSADELAAWIVWLASPEAGWVTGAVVPVDGGQALPGGLSRIAGQAEPTAAE
jgi:NAD(P)-dependent dehydrogenase (short-subunit alcohol dehydrogenase family)